MFLFLRVFWTLFSLDCWSRANFALCWFLLLLLPKVSFCSILVPYFDHLLCFMVIAQKNHHYFLLFNSWKNNAKLELPAWASSKRYKAKKWTWIVSVLTCLSFSLFVVLVGCTIDLQDRKSFLFLLFFPTDWLHTYIYIYTLLLNACMTDGVIHLYIYLPCCTVKHILSPFITWKSFWKSIGLVAGFDL